VALTGDIEKGFLMIGIRESDRDMLRFLWLQDPFQENSKLLHFRFTRLVFGLRPSPGSVISHHLEKYSSEHPRIVDKLEQSLYVDDLYPVVPLFRRPLKSTSPRSGSCSKEALI